MRFILLVMFRISTNELGSPTEQITSILCPAMESITLPPYNLVHQMATCYEYPIYYVSSLRLFNKLYILGLAHVR